MQSGDRPTPGSDLRPTDWGTEEAGVNRAERRRIARELVQRNAKRDGIRLKGESKRAAVKIMAVGLKTLPLDEQHEQIEERVGTDERHAYTRRKSGLYAVHKLLGVR